MVPQGHDITDQLVRVSSILHLTLDFSDSDEPMERTGTMRILECLLTPAIPWANETGREQDRPGPQAIRAIGSAALFQ